LSVVVPDHPASGAWAPRFSINKTELHRDEARQIAANAAKLRPAAFHRKVLRNAVARIDSQKATRIEG
jgi:hypothetical protein